MAKVLGLSFYLVAAAIMASGALVLLRRLYFSRAPAEWIVFCVSGKRPFEDWIYAIGPKGGPMETVLKPQSDRSFVAVSGNSLQGMLIVTVHAVEGGDRAENHLYVHRRRLGSWDRLLVPDGTEGNGVLAPDSASLVLTRSTGTTGGLPKLWILDLATNHLRCLASSEDGWDTDPRWRPDGSAIAYIP
jgi:hypothetical protein